MNNPNTPHSLVSCTVLSYNSAKTITETLDSIAAQTYPEIELIISDDCSRDNTVEICIQWLELNRSRFVRTELITVDKNTGVSANSNRAFAACMGEWKKGIAADDILLPNCVEDFMAFVSEHPEVRWVSSYIRKYDVVIAEQSCVGRNIVISKSFFEKNINEQLEEMARRCALFAPSLFFNVSMMREISGYDSSYVAEDYPFYLKALEHGYKCYFMPHETVGYRIHDSLCRSGDKLFNYAFKKQMRRFKKEKCFKYLSGWERLGVKLLWIVDDILEKLHLNKKKQTLVHLYSITQSFVYHVFGVSY